MFAPLCWKLVLKANKQTNTPQFGKSALSDVMKGTITLSENASQPPKVVFLFSFFCNIILLLAEVLAALKYTVVEKKLSDRQRILLNPNDCLSKISRRIYFVCVSSGLTTPGADNQMDHIYLFIVQNK